MADLIFGWKAFSIKKKEGSSALLLAGGFNNPWETKKMEARCNKDLSSDYAPLARPHLLAQESEACSCGTYSWNSVEGLLKNNFSIRNVYAHVVHWGAIVQHEGGYRAEFTRIERLWIITDKHFTLICKILYGVNDSQRLAEKIGGYYGVPCSAIRKSKFEATMNH